MLLKVCCVEAAVAAAAGNVQLHVFSPPMSERLGAVVCHALGYTSLPATGLVLATGVCAVRVRVPLPARKSARMV